MELEVNSSSRILDQKAQAIPGLGEAAFSVGDEFLFVTKNGVGFNLYFPFGSKEPGTIEKAKLVAAKALERL